MDIFNNTDEPVDYKIETETDEIVPVVGMGVTYLCGSDRYPATIIKVHTPNKLTIRMDDGVHITPQERVIRKHKNGAWCDTIGMPYRIGDREYYLDTKGNW